MKNKKIQGALCILAAAFLAGFAFIFQKLGADHLGAFAFNALRYLIAGIVLIPVVYVFSGSAEKGAAKLIPNRDELFAGAVTGVVLFLGAALQQAGIAYTTAGKTAFITGLNMVIVPIYGLFLKQKVHVTVWFAAVLAVIGLYFLSMGADAQFVLQKGDFIVLVGAFAWAAHIVMVDWFLPKVDPIKYSWIQLLAAGFISIAAALIFEQDTLTLQNIRSATVGLLYCGIGSAGIGYTLLILGQRHVKPAPAILIMGTEAVFAAAAGYLVLHETLGLRELFGCALMVAGMLLAQYKALASRN